MEYVNEKTFYHIQREKPNFKFWEPGETYFIGSCKNHFISYYDTAVFGLTSSIDMKSYYTNYLFDAYKEKMRGESFPPDLDLSLENIARDVSLCLNSYLVFIRETIFEEVRANSFPQLPSRQRGLWVIPDNELSPLILGFWFRTLRTTPSARLAKLELTGKIHWASQSFLDIESTSIDNYRLRAFKYWNGADVQKKPLENECIFEGFVNVINVVSLENPLEALSRINQI